MEAPILCEVRQMLLQDSRPQAQAAIQTRYKKGAVTLLYKARAENGACGLACYSSSMIVRELYTLQPKSLYITLLLISSE